MCRAIFAELSDYLDEQLDDSLCEELGRHMAGSEPYQAFVAGLEATIGNVMTWSSDCPPAKAAKLREELMQRYQRVTLCSAEFVALHSSRESRKFPVQVLTF